MITQEYLKSILKYDPKTGRFFWLINKHGCGGAVRVGKQAGSKDSKGKEQIKINGKLYFAHRLAFLYMEGELPANHVDHINRNHQDNRWSNLRHATIEQNMMNRVFKKRKVELPRGVYQAKSGRFFSSIQKNGKLNYLGIFDTIKEAHEVYLKELSKKPSFSHYISD
jgi:hypothetical protein